MSSKNQDLVPVSQNSQNIPQTSGKLASSESKGNSSTSRTGPMKYFLNKLNQMVPRLETETLDSDQESTYSCVGTGVPKLKNQKQQTERIVSGESSEDFQDFYEKTYILDQAQAAVRENLKTYFDKFGDQIPAEVVSKSLQNVMLPFLKTGKAKNTH